MSDTVITVDKLSKLYRIGTAAQRHDSLRELIMSAATAPLRRLRRLGEASAADAGAFWALKDVSFEVKRGEVLGIIGRNGAGKSTLLKILSRIVEPTEGRVRMRGRVASLLEVGTGFHPELTGRENIYLNGAILGMKKAEIDRKFDEIVAFSEIEKFLDTPVKRYSSGMYVRLAFAVAAHLDPEILICDEVLAVGDAAFQKKCLGKMQEVSRGQGRTVLFVSHNMAAVQSLCPKSILLKEGRAVAIGTTQDVVAVYVGTGLGARKDVSRRTDREGDGSLRITGLSIASGSSDDVDVVHSGSEVRFVLDYATKREICRPIFFLGVYDSYGMQLLHMNTRATGTPITDICGTGRISCIIPRLPLAPGRYYVTVAVMEQRGTMLDRVPAAAELVVEAGDFYGTGDTSVGQAARFLVAHEWRSEPRTVSAQRVTIA